MAVGAILCGGFSFTERKESRSDFRCDVRDEIDKDIIREECYHQYLQNHELGIPSYFFFLINVSLIAIVTMLYSYHVKSTVRQLEGNYQDAEGVLRDRRGSRRLFRAYLFQLVVSIALGITFIALLETHLLYPTNFLCSNKKISAKFVLNRTQSTNSFSCSHDRAGNKNFWTKTATAANAIYAICALLEILLILKRAIDATEFMNNQDFYAYYLKSNPEPSKRPLVNDNEQPNDQRQAQPEAIPLVEQQDRAGITTDYSEQLENSEIAMTLEHPEQAQAQKDFQSSIHTLKENCLQGTEQLSDLKHPFGRPNPGEGSTHDLTMDEIYVNVAIREGAAHHNSAKNLHRWEQSKEAKNCHFAKPEDIIDKEHRNILVVGRPGIGKTSFCTKILRRWASGEAFNGDHGTTSAHFDVVFLVKFRLLNDIAELSLRELLARAETVQRLDDSVWDFITKEPTKVLLIFDGLDEYSSKEDINAQEDDSTHKNDVEETMPVSVLYNKLAAGKLLRGASILTTTRPKAVEFVEHVNFQRTVEIRAFTSENVEEYVEKFTRHVPGAKEKMWEHIKSNINLFSFCYIPMKCFLICHCLLQIILFDSSQALPKKMTDMYEMIVKMFLFNHNREGFSPEEKSTHLNKPFDKFPEELQNILNRLGKIAFKGIEERRLLFESSEVSGLEECGLLHKLPDVQSKRSLNEPPKSQFSFPHLAVQEFFAARHLVDTKTDEIEEFLRKHLNDARWQEVLQFAAGLLKSSTDIFIKLLPKSTATTTVEWSSKPETLTSWPAAEADKLLAVQVCKCLYEINDEQQPLLQNKIAKINFNSVSFSDCSLAPTDLAGILHFLENAEDVLHIDLSLNEIGDLGAKEVKKFVVNRERKLKRLNLRNNDFTDITAKDLAAALEHSNCKLEWLDLSYNKFTDNAAKYLAAALKHSNCKLRHLDLRPIIFSKEVRQNLTDAAEHRKCKIFLGESRNPTLAARGFSLSERRSRRGKTSGTGL